MSLSRMSSLASGSEMIVKPLDVVTVADKLNRLFPSLQLTPVDIQEPTGEIMCSVYQHITQYIMDIPDAVYTTPPFNFQSICGVEMFAHAYPQMVTFKALSAIVEDISANEIEFSFLDLIMPEPRSTRILLSKLINFIEFASVATKAAFFGNFQKANEIFDSVDKRRIELESKKRQIIELKSELQRLQSELNNRKRAENELRGKMEILEHNVKETYVETEALDAELKAVSESKAEIGKKLKELQSEGKRLTFQNEVADRDIVNSPDRLQAELNDLMKFLENIQKDISAERRKNREYMEKKKTRVVVLRALERIAESLNKLRELQKNRSAMEGIVAEAEEQRNAAKDDCKDIQVRVANENCKLRSMEKECEKEEVLHVKVMTDVREHLAALNEQVREMRRRIQDFDKESMEVQKEVGKVRNEIATLNRTANADVRKLAARLESVVNMYFEAERQYTEDCERVVRLKNSVLAALNAPDDEGSTETPSTGSISNERSDI